MNQFNVKHEVCYSENVDKLQPLKHPADTEQSYYVESQSAVC